MTDPITDAARFGAIIAARRKDMRLTQDQLARLVGCSRPTIVQTEQGATMPRLGLALRLMSELRLKTEDVIEGIGDDPD